MDEWDTVDVASTVACAMGGLAVAAPLAIGFSIFMAGEASTQSLSKSLSQSDISQDKEDAKPESPCKKSSGPRDIMNYFDAPRPSWAN